MSPSTPQNAFPSPDPSGNDDQRNPLGFADVRAVEAPVAPSDAPTGIPVGFAPRVVGTDPVTTVSFTSDPVFRTEISFRRDHAIHTAVRAETASSGGDGRPAMGHAESRAFDLDADVTDADDAPLDEFWSSDDEAGSDRVPFYKKEISFGRKREPVTRQEPVRAEAQEATPFYKREITFGRKKDEAPAVASPDVAGPTEDEAPFYKRELSFKRRKPTVAAVEAPTEDQFVDPQVSAPEPTPAAAVEPVVSLVPEPAPVAETVHAMSMDEPAAPEPELAPAAEPELDPAAEAELDIVVVDEELGAEPAFAARAEELLDLVDDDPIEIVSFDEPLSVEPVAAEPVASEPVVELPVAAAPAPAGEHDDPVEEPVAAAATPGKRSSVRSGRGAAKPKKAKTKKPASGKGRRVVGIKIGASQLAAAVVQESGGRHELLQLVRQPIETGLVVDGEVRDATRLGEVLKAFVEEHDLPRTNVRIGLASNRIGVRTVEIEGIDDAERFDNAVRFKAHEVLPVAFHESVLDYRVVEERPVETGETSKRVLLVVAPRDQVEPYLRACETAGLRLSGIDLEALGLLRTFVEAHPIGFRAGDDTATVVVSLGHESTTLLVAGGGVCDFTRVFDWGGDTLQQAIATELGVDAEQAATILRHLSLAGRGRDLDSLSEDDRIRANEAIRSRLTPFARELVSSLQFYQTQPDSLGIGEIVITGGTAHLTGLADALHQMIGVSVRFGDPLGRVVSLAEIPDGLHARIGSMAVPIGLAIEDAPWRSVNLLPSEVRQQGRKKPNVLAFAAPAVAAVSIAALAFAFVQAKGDASDRQAELSAVQAQIASLPEPSGPTIDPALQGDQVSRAQSVAQVLGGRLAWEPFFRDLSRALPANVWLEHIAAEAPSMAVALPVAVDVQNSTPPVATGVTIDGHTYTPADVALLLARLQAIPSIKNVTLKSVRHEKKGAEGGKVDIVNFSIIADLNGGAQ